MMHGAQNYKFLCDVYCISPFIPTLNYSNLVHALSFSFFKPILILSFPTHLVPPSGLFHSGFPAKTLDICRPHAMFTAHSMNWSPT